MHSQFFVFAVSLGCGVLIGILFDVFRAFRQKFRFSNIVVGVQDVFFWLSAALITFLLTRYANGGELRWYVFFASFCGAVLYNATVSRAVVRVFLFTINLLGYAFGFILKVLLFPASFLLRLLKKPFIFICIPLRKTARFLKTHTSRWGETAKKVKKRLKLY